MLFARGLDVGYERFAAARARPVYLEGGMFFTKSNNKQKTAQMGALRRYLLVWGKERFAVAGGAFASSDCCQFCADRWALEYRRAPYGRRRLSDFDKAGRTGLERPPGVAAGPEAKSIWKCSRRVSFSSPCGPDINDAGDRRIRSASGTHVLHSASAIPCNGIISAETKSF